MGDRIYSIDSMRIVAMAFVVAIHTDPFRGLGAYGNTLNFLIDSTARFAVPFFFVTSGYFFARKTETREPIGYFADRAATIASIYAFGLLLSTPVFLAGAIVRAGGDTDIASIVLRELIEFTSPLTLVYYGNSVSEILWFLPALLFSLGLICLFVAADRTAHLVPVALGFHVIGLLGASYTMFVDVPFEVRDALFFGFFYTSLGYWLHAGDWRPNADRSPSYLGATVLFGALHVAERYVLGYALTGESVGQSVYAPSYSIATVLVTLSLFAFLLSRPTLGRSTPLPSWGAYAVGIYVTHPAVLYVLELTRDLLEGAGYGVENTILWHLALTPATFFGALLVSLAAHRLGAIEIGGSHLPVPSRIRNHDSG
ncbi:acyltransferase [Haloterrigena alkaliphila]|uniref:Acyltransferase n=1 Tax=Haloterrigena alkaliphila TaxID=2816475 RepID=A0A8A2VCU3_9EURY|nr:acyltransferase [Haloterrigena alkaliphila]QSW99863.1 acyltransferase [Haloterrigena alkaliphila]